MNINIKKDFMPICKNRPGRKLKKLKGFLIHYTANYSKGANAKMHRSYFSTTDRYASSQFVVDDKEIIQLMPINEVAWHGGGRRYTNWANSIREGINVNYFMIGIEMCVNADGDFSETEKNTAYLVARLLSLPENKHLSIDDVKRHYDATGKLCPKMYIEQKQFDRFLELVLEYIKMIESGYINHDNINRVDKYVRTLSNLNARKGPDVKFDIEKEFPKGTIINIDDYADGWYMTNEGNWVSAMYCTDVIVTTNNSSPDSIKLEDDTISRMGPSEAYDIYEMIPKGTVVNLGVFVNGYYEIGSERYIKSNNNWKGFDITEVESDPILKNESIIGKGTINVSQLNIRERPTVNSRIVGKYKKHDNIDITATSSEWVQTDKGWVHGYYVDERYNRDYVTLTFDIEVKENPTNKSKTLCTLKKGHITVILDECKTGKVEWLRLKEGWVRRDIITKTKNTLVL